MSVNQPPGFVKPQEQTKDAFLGGKLSIVQPRVGFRAGLDSVLLGAGVTAGTGRMLELGSGVGVASLVALTHAPGLEATLVEIDAPTATLARQNIEENGFSQRARVVTLDVTASGAERTAAGVPTDHFDFVIANPPFFANGTPAPDAARAHARHMDPGALDGWVRTAVSCTHAKGEVMFIHAAAALPALLGAFASRMGDLTILPLSPRMGEPASRILIKGRKGSRAPVRLLPTLTLHGSNGNAFVPEIEAVFRGTARFDWHLRK